MAYGLRIWDANSNLTLDVTDRITRFVTSITPGTIDGGTTVSYNVDGIVDDGTWFLVVMNTWRRSEIDFVTQIVMTITSNYINLYNSAQSSWTNGLGTRIEVFRG